MSFWKQSARFALGAGTALLLVVAAPVSAEPFPEPLDDHATATPAKHPSATLPGPPEALADIVPLRLNPGNGSLPAVVPIFGRATLQFSPGFATDGPIVHLGGFSTRLLARMNHEARRFRRDNVSEFWGAPRNVLDEDRDSIAEARRGAEASRVITRSLHRVLDDELDRLARTSLGLGPTLDLLQGLSLRRSRTGASGRAGGPAAPRPEGPAAERADRARGDIGLRLDAHPALILRGRFRSLRGRVELPARDEPARLSLESPVGTCGRAVLSSGLPRDGRGWTTLTFNFSF